MNINTCIDELIIYAQNNLYLDELDVDFVRNGILDILGLDSYKPGLPDENKVEKLNEPGLLLKEIAECAIQNRLSAKDGAEELKAKIMKKLYAKPSKINDMFFEAGGSGSDKAQSFLMEYVKAANFGGYTSGCFVEGLTDDGIAVMSVETEGYPEELMFSKAVDSLIGYAKVNLLLDEFDEGYARRAIFEIFGAKNYVVEHDVLTDDEEAIEEDRPDRLLIALLAAAEGAGFRIDDSESLKNRVMGVLSLLPSEIEDLCADFGDKKKMDFLYDYSGKNYYLKKTDIERNIRFKTGYTYHDIEVIINKNNDAMYPSVGKNGYPECPLCRETIGYMPMGYANKRTAPITLDGEEYDWSFVSYGYLPRFGIAVAAEHGKKSKTSHIVNALADFVDKYPTFFAGIDAPLDGTGSFSTSHEYILAGDEMLPISKVKSIRKLEFTKYPLAEISVLDWCTTAIRVTSQSRTVLSEIIDVVKVAWENYSDSELGIISKDSDGRHNGINIIMRKYPGKYSADIVFRSNVKSKKFPNGIFNTHPDHAVIKAEDNNFLDVAGLFVLPSVSEMEIKVLKECLSGQQELPEEMSQFGKMYDSIIKENGKIMTKIEAGIYIKAAFCTTCQSILEDVAVFKTPDETVKFLSGLGFFVPSDN